MNSTTESVRYPSRNLTSKDSCPVMETVVRFGMALQQKFSMIFLKFQQTMRWRNAWLRTVFRQKFGNVEAFRCQGPAIGPLHLYIEERPIFYLVTKKHSNEKLTYRSVWDSLRSLRNHLLQEDITKLVIPKIGYCLESLNWRIIRSMIEELFRYTEIEVLVCCHNAHEADVTRKL